jgi:hypothetical protein
MSTTTAAATDSDAGHDPAGDRMATDSPTTETQIFVSYSHHDAAYVGKDSLLGFLMGLENDGARFWWDQSLQAGDIWDDEIKEHLLQADVALVLVSQWLLDSRYVRDVEVRVLLERVRLEGLIIFPVIVSASDWQRYGWLSRLQHLPEGDKTLAEHYSGPGVREAMFLKIREALRARLKGNAPAETAIEATSGAVNLINSLEPEYRSVVANIPEPREQHGLRFEGLGAKIRITRIGQPPREITADDLRHLPLADLETITALQKGMRHYHDRWVSLYSRRENPGVEQELRSLARELAPDLAAVIERLAQFGLDLEDHYSRFYDFVVSFGQG